MTRQRGALLVLVTGIAVCTWRDAPVARAPIRAGEYQILSGDFHVHAFVGDGGIAPWMLQRQAARAGLDVIAVTNHNQTLAGQLGQSASRQSTGPMVISGEEITGRDFHLIAVGIERTVDWDQPASGAIAQVHAQGGVAIAAHPMDGFNAGYDDQSLAALDGIEAAKAEKPNPLRARQVEEFRRRVVAHNPAVAIIGSSDFHMAAPLGECRTFLLVRERTEAAVLDAIRDGRTVGRCMRGPLTGRPELVRLVEPFRDALAAPDGDLISRIATFLVWGSLVALAFLGPRPS